MDRLDVNFLQETTRKNATGCVAAVSTVSPNFLLPAAADA